MDISNLQKKNIIKNTFIPIIGKDLTQKISASLIRKIDYFLELKIENDSKCVKILEEVIKLPEVKSDESQELIDDYKNSVNALSLDGIKKMTDSMELRSEQKKENQLIPGHHTWASCEA